MPQWIPEERTGTSRNGVTVRYTVVQKGKFNELFGKLWSLRTRKGKRRVKPCRICRVPIEPGTKAWRSLDDCHKAVYVCTECMPEG